MSKYRTEYCENLYKKEKENTHVQVAGWINIKRDHGELLFIDLFDFTEEIQCVINKDIGKINKIPIGSVVTIKGQIVLRDNENVNVNKKNGHVEIKVSSLEILNLSETLPFLPNDNISEINRLQYRTLYLRSSKMQKMLKMRSDLLFFLHHYMQSNDFLLVQTPLITVSSPEGARDFIVPSRLHPGKFYALPQAPQIFKQLLMCSGVKKYYQIAPCFRDEDARSDRCYGEFYQLDIEMSFVEEKDITDFLFSIGEAIINKFDKKQIIKKTVTWHESMRQWGSDKPDLRNPLLITEYTEYFRGTNMILFSQLISNGSQVFGISVDNEMTSTQKKAALDWCFTNYKFRAAYVSMKEGVLDGPIKEFITWPLKENETIFFVCSKWEECLTNLGHLRKYLGQQLKLICDNHCLLVVNNFPMFCEEEIDNKKEKTFKHNPFSKIKDDSDDINKVTAYQYDLVLNGHEIASGSIRENQWEKLLENFLRCGNYTKEQVEKNFKAMFNAFRFGCPPHGGAALGLDRILMILLKEENVREVVAFPLNTRGQDMLCGAPTEVDESVLGNLSIQIIKK